MYVLVSPFSKTFDDIWLTYIVPDFLVWEIKIWQVIEIPIKNFIELWVVLDIFETVNTDYDESKIKSIISIKNHDIFLSNYRVELMKWISKYYFTAIHNSLNLFFPKNLRDKIQKDKVPKLNFINSEQNLYDYKFQNDVNISKEQNSSNYTFEHNINLSKEQNIVLNDILETEKQKILLYGLTWSWKTEIYIKLIKHYLDLWQQTLFLIPEIILTNQLSNKIKNVFWKEVIIINSTITDATKSKYWIDIYNVSAKIIVWTRSAIFYPYNNLWLIIIDEEHDNSYISDSAPRYNTIEVAEKISEYNWTKLILASGTPSVKSMYKAVKWDYKIVNLLKKYS